MAHFQYTGDPQHGGDGPDTVVAFGHTFPKGQPVEVADEAIAAKLAGNSHFEAVEMQTEPKPAKPRKASGDEG